MTNLFYMLADAATKTPQKGGTNLIVMGVFVVGFIAIFYFLTIRPQSKKKKEMEAMLSSLKKGDQVVSIGGIHGKVVSVKDNEIVVRVGANAEIVFDKNAINKVAKKSKEEKETKKIEEKKESK